MFLVRKGNPKGIKDWDDLVKPGVSVDHAEPEDLGRRALELPRRLGLRAAAARRRRGQGARSSSAQLYKNVPVLDSGARGSTTTFVERGIGDVLIAWENEALLAIKELGPDKFEIVVPSLSILAEPPVAVVDKVVDKHGTAGRGRGLPRVPLHATRARRSSPSTTTGRATPTVAAKYAAQFPKIELFTIDEVFGGWTKAQKTHFADGGVVRPDLPAGALAPARVYPYEGMTMRQSARRVLPGFGLRLGFTCIYLSLHRADPARHGVHAHGRALLGRVLGAP